MDQDTAKKLLVEGGTFIFLGVPEDTIFGIDMQCWNTDENFRGIKMIPPGLHYIFYAAVSRETGDFSERAGFMHYFHKKEFLVKMWDKDSEDISGDELVEETIQRLKDNLFNLDRQLAPYPYVIWQKWKLLTSQISAELATKLSPDTGIIRSSVELMATTDADRPRGVKTPPSTESQEGTPEGTEGTPEGTEGTPEGTEGTLEGTEGTPEGTEGSPAETPDQPPSELLTSELAVLLDQSSKLLAEQSTSGQSDAKRAKRLTREEMEDAMLPNLQPTPGASMKFTEIPRDKYPPGSSPEEITKHYLDQSYSLELMIAQHDEPLHVIGELQFAYLCFLIGHSQDAFEHWKNMVILLCSCDDAIHKYRSVFFHFIRSLEIQIEEMPEDFLADIVMNKNLIYKKLREFFRTAYMSKIDGRLLTLIERFKENLTTKLQWDFTGLDEDEEDERPVVVGLDDEAIDDAE